MDQINAASSLEVLRIPPSNHLEALQGDLAGFWSLRINDQWRIIFRWEGNDAQDVKITDYLWVKRDASEETTTYSSR